MAEQIVDSWFFEKEVRSTYEASTDFEEANCGSAASSTQCRKPVASRCMVPLTPQVMWPGQKFGLKVENVLHKEKSQYQVRTRDDYSVSMGSHWCLALREQAYWLVQSPS